MGAYAVVRHDYVDNVIVLNANQVEEFETALDAELVDAIPYGLCIGDLRVGGQWTRNLNGVQVVLEPLTPQQQTDYAGMRETFAEAEAALTEGVESIG